MGDLTVLQRVDHSTGSGSVVEWGPASSGVVRGAPVHTTTGKTGLRDTSVLLSQVLCSFSCALLVQTNLIRYKCSAATNGMGLVTNLPVT